MPKKCKYCERKPFDENVDVCESCNNAYLDGKKAGIKHAQHVMRTAMGCAES